LVRELHISADQAHDAIAFAPILAMPSFGPGPVRSAEFNSCVVTAIAVVALLAALWGLPKWLYPVAALAYLYGRVQDSAPVRTLSGVSVNATWKGDGAVAPGAALQEVSLPEPKMESRQARVDIVGHSVPAYAPQVFGPNRVNVTQALLKRAIAPPPPHDENALAALISWLKSNSDQIFGRAVKVQPMDRDAWVQGTNSSKGMKALLRREWVRAESVGLGYASRCRGKEAVRITTRGAFNKVEFTLSSNAGSDASACPRLISAATPMMTSITGPWVTAFQGIIKRRFNGLPFLFACGKRSNDVAAAMTTRALWRHFENDFSAFDLSVRREWCDFEIWLAKRFGAPQLIVDLLTANVETHGYTRCGLRYLCEGTRKSGDTWTTVMNSVINMCSHLYVFCKVRQCDVTSARAQLNMTFMGDDNWGCHTGDPIDWSGEMAPLGFKVKPLYRPELADVTFCSMRLTRTSLGWVLLPKIGRAFSKGGYTLRLNGADSDRFVRGVALGLRDIASGHPLFASYNESVLRITEGRSAARIEDRPWAMGLCHTGDCTDDTIADVCHQYGLTPTGIEDCVAYFNSLRSFVDLDHPVVDRCCDVDTEATHLMHIPSAPYPILSEGWVPDPAQYVPSCVGQGPLEAFARAHNAEMHATNGNIAPSQACLLAASVLLAFSALGSSDPLSILVCVFCSFSCAFGAGVFTPAPDAVASPVRVRWVNVVMNGVVVRVPQIDTISFLRWLGLPAGTAVWRRGTDHTFRLTGDDYYPREYDVLHVSFAERTSTDVPIDRTWPIPNDGAGEQFAEGWNARMHAANGNATKRSHACAFDYDETRLRACEADRHNRDQHSANGNPLAALSILTVANLSRLIREYTSNALSEAAADNMARAAINVFSDVTRGDTKFCSFEGVSKNYAVGTQSYLRVFCASFGVSPTAACTYIFSTTGGKPIEHRDDAVSDFSVRPRLVGGSAITKIEKAMTTMSERVGVKPSSMPWLYSYVDPFHDREIKTDGPPDDVNAPGVPICYRQSITFSSSQGSTDLWDLDVVLYPSNAYVNQDTPTKLTNTLYRITNSNQLGTGAAGGLAGYQVVSGNSMPISAQSSGISLIPTTTVADNCRIYAVGMECINSTSPLNQQGTCTVWRQAMPDRLSSSTICYANGVSSGYVPFGYTTALQCGAPPTTLAEAMILTGTRQWHAKEGAMIVGTYNSLSNPPSNSESVTPVYYDDLNNKFYMNSPATTQCADSTSAVIVYVSNFVNNLVAPFNMSGAYFSGLSPTTTITVNLRTYVQRFPTDSSNALTPLAQPTPPYDPTAISLAAFIMEDAPPGVMLRENGFGDWLRDVAGKVADFVAPIAGAVRDVAGGVMGAVNGFRQGMNPQPVQASTAVGDGVRAAINAERAMIRSEARAVGPARLVAVRPAPKTRKGRGGVAFTI
jgi:hypothetical protein